MTENQLNNIIIENRNKFNFTGIKDVLNFDEETIVMLTDFGKLTLKGSDLHITEFNNEIGELSGSGNVFALAYTKDSTENIFSRLFK